MNVDGELQVRLATFAAIFMAMSVWEVVAARRERRLSRRRRWTSNLGIAALDTVVVRLVIPVSLAGVAMMAEDRGWGLLNQFSIGPLPAIVLSVIVLDLIIYLQHVLFHAVPVLWRLHMMHHSDVDFDFTTGIRFHPIEVALSMLLKLAAVVALGVPAMATLVFEVLLNATAMFNHGNVSLPPTIDRPVRWLLVTPDMHRVHHSTDIKETNSNFGFCLSWWDRLLGTYRHSPKLGQDGMKIGLEHIGDTQSETLLTLLTLPFRRSTGSYPLGRREPTSKPGEESSTRP